MADDYSSFAKINARLLNPPTPLKHIPIRIYIPSTPPGGDAIGTAAPGSFKVMQSLVSPRLPNREFTPPPSPPNIQFLASLRSYPNKTCKVAPLLRPRARRNLFHAQRPREKIDSSLFTVVTIR